TELFRIERQRVKSLKLDHPGGDEDDLLVTRDKPSVFNFTVQNIPDGYKQKSPTSANSAGSLLSYLNLSEVKPASEVEVDEEGSPVATLATFDGLVVTVRQGKKDDKQYALFDVTVDEDVLTSRAA